MIRYLLNINYFECLPVLIHLFINVSKNIDWGTFWYRVILHHDGIDRRIGPKI